MSISMKDVAKLAGVSTATVSYVINNNRAVKDSTRIAVNTAIKKLGYQVNPTARKLRNGKSKQIIFIVSDLKNYFFMEIAKGIQEILKEANYSLLFIDSNESIETEKNNIEMTILEDYAGLIVAPVQENWENLGKTIENKPCVFLDRHPQNIDRDFILTKNFQGGFILTEELIKSGHKKIAFISGRYDSTIQERLEGYREALRKYNLPIDKNLEIFGENEPKIYYELATNDIWDSTLDNLISKEKITGIVAGNSVFSFSAMNYFQRKNIKVPDEIGLATFDNPFWLNLNTSLIISLPQDVVKIGQKAAKVILDRINGTNSPYKEYRIDTLPINKII